MIPKFKHKQLKFNEGDLIYSIGDEAKNVYLILLIIVVSFYSV